MRVRSLLDTYAQNIFGPLISGLYPYCVHVHKQARSQTMHTVGIARYSMGAYTFFRYIYIYIYNATYSVSTCYP